MKTPSFRGCSLTQQGSCATPGRVLLPTSLVDCDLPIYLVDARTKGALAFSESVEESNNKLIGRWLTFTVRDLPAVGSARVDVRLRQGPGKQAPFEPEHPGSSEPAPNRLPDPWVL